MPKNLVLYGYFGLTHRRTACVCVVAVRLKLGVQRASKRNLSLVEQTIGM